MKNGLVALVGIILIGMGLVSACGQEPPPEGALSVSELLQDPLYDTKVTIYGQVSQLGEIKCPCFELSSGGESVLVWYAWYEGDWPTVSVKGIQNGDQVVVTGELQTVGADRPSEFAASSIEKQE
jgi:hypothetical protein